MHNNDIIIRTGARNGGKDFEQALQNIIMTHTALRVITFLCIEGTICLHMRTAVNYNVILYPHAVPVIL